MGYYTYFTLEHTNNKKQEVTEEQVCAALAEINADYFGMKNSRGEIATSYDELFYDEMKWYDHQKDMVELSKRFPHTMFKLDGNGEEYDDFWKEYYLNGMLVEVPGEIVYHDEKAAPLWSMFWNEEEA